MEISLRGKVFRNVIKRLFKDSSRPIEELRRGNGLESIPKAMLPAGVECAETTLAGRPALELRPVGREGGRVVVYYHGGGYVSGSPASYRMLASLLAVRSGSTVYVPDYRLAPEHPFPAALDDAVAAYRAIVSSGTPAGSIAVAGDSAGGGLALAALMALRDSGDPMPSSLTLLCPWADLRVQSPSCVSNAAADIVLTASALREWASMYAAGLNLADPGLSPALGTYEGLPPMLVQSGSDEILLDDAKAVSAAAAQSGVDVSLRVWQGMWHCWQILGTLVPESADAITEMGEFIDTRFRP